MTALNSDAGMAVSLVTGTKECDAYSVRRLTGSDTESARISLDNEIIAARVGETIAEMGRTHDYRHVESTIAWWREKLLALRFYI